MNQVLGTLLAAALLFHMGTLYVRYRQSRRNRLLLAIPALVIGTLLVAIWL